MGGERAGRVGTGSHSAAGRRGPDPSHAPECDGGEEIRLDTHTRTQLGTSPGGSRREPGGGRDSTSRGEPGAHAAWPRRLQDPGREDPSRTDCCSFRLIGRKQAAQGPVTEDAGGSPLGAQSLGPRRCPRGARRMLTSSRRGAAGPGTARTRAPAAAPAVPAPRERALPYLAPASRGSAGNAP